MEDVHVVLNSSFEKNVRPYIDLINEISDFGLGTELDLPSVVVIGDQSSGKSSILEAISGVQLPRGNEITTRCPIELHLKKAAERSVRIDFTNKNGKKFSKLVDLKDLDKELRAAQDELTAPRKVTDSKIILKIQGPSCPDLTLTDLPGIVRTSVDGDKDIVRSVRQLIDSYIARESVIILCVIPAHLDLATNETLTIAERHDKARKRTIGVVTKADLVERDCEGGIMSLLTNPPNALKLRLGYYIVRCRSASELKMTHVEAMRMEKKFFDEHPKFRTLHPNQRGTHSLSTGLTQVLVSHMKEQMPRLVGEVKEKLTDVQKQLDSLGTNIPVEPEGKRLFMMGLLDGVRSDLDTFLIKGAHVPKDVVKCENVPVNEIEFEECDTSFLWRSLFNHFNQEISNITTGHLHFQKGNLNVKTIQNRMTALRGKELPRFFNFDLFEELIRGHLKLYEDPALECLEEITQGVEQIAMFVCAERLKAFPALLVEVQNTCRQVLEECHGKAKEMIFRELKKEDLIYTQDSTYLSEIKKQIESKETPNSASSSVSGADFTKQLSVHLLQNEGEEGNEDQHNAYVMHHIVTVYLNVVNTRLSDTVPQAIRLDLYVNFVVEIKKAILRSFFKDDTSLIDEDEETCAKRRDLTARIEALKNVMKKLKTFEK